jgi:uncharacterized protein
MKRIFIGMIVLYQKGLSPILKQILGVPAMCRYSPSCSEYAKIVIYKYGIAKGGVMAVKRLLSCQPFAHPDKQIIKS